MSGWMIYGANGYTGRLVARLVAQRGEQPILAGRSADKLAALAAELGLAMRPFGLEDAVSGLAGVDVVAHCAGPFSATAAPMVDACLATGTHYVDINGEVEVLERLFDREEEARRSGVVLLPAVGYDVVPTDCLAAMVAADLPGAIGLELASAGLTRLSPGTLKTWVEAMGQGGRARVDGRLRRVPPAWRTRTVPFPSGPRRVTTIPYGDVVTAYRSTGIPNITTYGALPVTLVRAQRIVEPLFRMAAVRRAATAVAGRVRGPGERTRAGIRTEFWAEARDAAGRTVTKTLRGPEGYGLTADAVVTAVSRLRSGAVVPGVHTPSTAFGADFVLELESVAVSRE